ncbi:rRNA maturation RNase YbeY, partial [Anaerotignum sp.]|uniref:rRNA maturation RNase YbeY n=1 Tax=Anaerotignum sp. TaxID=2039241 RepID=UPI0039A2C9D9
MTVLIDIRTEGFPEELEAVMEKIALDSLKYEGFQEECEISISIVDNEEIHQINKQFRGIDRPTDVLSFPQLTFEEGKSWTETRTAKWCWGISPFLWNGQENR